ncbi:MULTISPECIES: Fur family transcriptional regulator [Streptomyces]|uniref:Fur family transcriptional regulator n=1 Tax=Streptomyces TaxID=1883 RepID=UPI0021AE0F1B|nr:transcriptional repressor [Streptomyces sp. WAC 04229]
MDGDSRAALNEAAPPRDPHTLLRRHGLRCTSARLRILSLLHSSEQHLTATEICDRLARSGSDRHHTTVYRSLEALTAVGVLHAVPGRGPTRYGMSDEPHHHVACQRCGHIADLPSAPMADAVARVEELTGLRPGASGSLLLYGLCASCSTDTALCP